MPLGDIITPWHHKIQNGGLTKELENIYLRGKHEYPMEITAVYNLLVDWNQVPCIIINIIGRKKMGWNLQTLMSETPTTGQNSPYRERKILMTNPT